MEIRRAVRARSEGAGRPVASGHPALRLLSSGGRAVGPLVLSGAGAGARPGCARCRYDEGWRRDERGSNRLRSRWRGAGGARLSAFAAAAGRSSRLEAAEPHSRRRRDDPHRRLRRGAGGHPRSRDRRQHAGRHLRLHGARAVARHRLAGDRPVRAGRDAALSFVAAHDRRLPAEEPARRLSRGEAVAAVRRLAGADARSRSGAPFPVGGGGAARACHRRSGARAPSRQPVAGGRGRADRARRRILALRPLLSGDRAAVASAANTEPPTASWRRFNG